MYIQSMENVFKRKRDRTCVYFRKLGWPLNNGRSNGKDNGLISMILFNNFELRRTCIIGRSFGVKGGRNEISRVINSSEQIHNNH